MNRGGTELSILSSSSMGKKEDRLYNEGFERACDIARAKGLDGLFAEQRMRGITGFKCRLTSSEIDYYSQELKDQVFGSIQIAFMSVLYDEFGFRGKRLARVQEGIDKMAAYMSNGWIYWTDMINEIKERTGHEIPLPDAVRNIRYYQRPDNEDIYSELDYINNEDWQARLNYLGLVDDGKEVKDPGGLWSWKYKNPADKIQIYDELGGIVLAVNCLGARKPGEGD